MIRWILSYVFLTIALWGTSVAARVHAMEAKLDYNRDVRPILSEHCFACHGFDQKSRQADLRLDQAESAYLDRDGTTAIAPGKIDASEVWQRIISDDEDLVMPPKEAHVPLEDAEKEIVKRWIEQGAVYAGHWSFIPPTKVALPKTFAEKPPIDAFILQKLAEEGLKPANEADRVTLIRRLSLDLTGLPPSGDQVTAFAKDASPDAYEKLVDRFLGSAHFGERIALDWLDAARYADTNGFSIDGGRNMWLWRDWVIQSFNDNLPYDQFLVQQLAGDLMPMATEATKIATGFQRNNMVTHEGGTIPEENLTNYNADRVKTLGESIMGLTLGCAQCHDHKFDPISQKDYFRTFAFFNSLSDRGLDGNGGINPGPSIRAKTILKTDELDGLRKRVAELERRLATPDQEITTAWEKRELAKLANRGLNLKTYPVRVIKVSTPNRGAGLDIEGEKLVRLTDIGMMGAFDISTELPKLDRPITAIRVVVHPVADLPGGGWGYGPNNGKKAKPKKVVPPKTKPEEPSTDNDPTSIDSKVTEVAKIDSEAGVAEANKSETDITKAEPEVPEKKGTFMLTALAATVDAVPGDQVNLFKLRPFLRVTANSWEPNHRPVECLDPRNDNGWSPDLQTEGAVHLTASLIETIDSTQTPFLTVQLNFGNGQMLVPGLVELQVLVGNDDGTDLPLEVIKVLKIPSEQRSSEEQQTLWTHCASVTSELERERIELNNLRERVTVFTEQFTTMVMDVAAKPRDTFILNRGDYAQPTEKVSPGTISSLPPMPDSLSADRYGLAQWLVMPEHPLTARVAVNRFWKLIFGAGLVGTAADFGSQGEWPSHPELLDWLSVDFRESGWNVKALIKQMVMSAAYRQDSRTSPAMLDRDPQNRLLARGPRFRLPAELIRDAALKTSGLLVTRIGGPSVNPYMPGDLWREVSHYGSSPATAQTFVQDHGEKLYRRSMYTFWKRTAPPPNMAAFDAPNREVCTIARGNTTTPLQALVTLNDVQFVEASRAFAGRILSKQNLNDNERIRWAFLEATSRPITDQELRILQQSLSRERHRYQNKHDAARAYLSVGESPIPDSIPIDELAAWSQLAAILLNLSESVTRP